MRILFFFIWILIGNILFSQDYINYPDAPKTNQRDTFFGQIIDDPYRILEHNGKLTQKWLVSQEKLAKIFKKKELKNFSAFYDFLYTFNYSNYKPLIKKGSNYYFYKYNDFFSVPSLYRQATYYGPSSLIINPQRFSTADEIYSIIDFEISSDERYIAFSLSESGKDWRTIKVRDNHRAKILDDEVKWVKYSNIYWKKNGFFYWKYDKPAPDNELLEKIKNQKLYYHRINTAQTEDEYIYDISEKELSHSSFEVTSDEKYLILYTFKKAQNKWIKAIIYKNLETWGEFETMLEYPDKNVEYTILDHIENTFYILTNYEANNYKIIAYNTDTKEISEIIHESDDVLDQVNVIANKIVGIYYNEGQFKLKIFDLNGNQIFDKAFKQGMQISGFEGNNNDTETMFYVSTFYSPPGVYKLNLTDNSIEFLTEQSFDQTEDQFETKYIGYPSKDGTYIPMYLTYKKGTDLQSGDNPVLLYGYGGFGMSLNPHYDPGYLLFIENGGVLAMPQVRGGGEFGTEWHDRGRKLNKQNSFDDFISAAEYLIHTKVTNPEKMAINGGSTGGLMVGATLTQRPDLFKAAVIEMGVLDMLRYDKYGIGYIHHQEYGSLSDSLEFMNILSYSPLHHLEKETGYPATLVITGENDDRVHPFHSYKFIAKLQKQSINKNPYLLYVEKQSGHYGSSTIDGKLNMKAYKYGFLFNQLGMSFKK